MVDENNKFYLIRILDLGTNFNFQENVYRFINIKEVFNNTSQLKEKLEGRVIIRDSLLIDCIMKMFDMHEVKTQVNR